jgi:hypothetical protein
MIKILFLGANPSDTTHLAIDREVREIRQRLYAALHGQHFQIEQEWAVSVGDLQAALLRHRPQLVHFSGHGDSSGKLQVLGTDSQAVSIPIHALGDLFHLVGDTVRCVVLNACFSAPQADAIRQHTDCVVGMTDAVADEAAITFAWAFYQALGFGRSIRAAFELGRNQLDLSAMADADVPALLVRPGVDPDGVRLLTTESANLGAPNRALPVSGEDSPGGEHNRISTNVTNIIGGSYGAIAIGQDATAIGTISHHYGRAQTLTQEQHKAAIREAEKALLDDEDRLASPVFEALRQFLRVAREIQVERRSVDDIRVEMTTRFTELWTTMGLPTRGFSSGLEVLGALSKHPAAGEVVKKLLGG